MRLSLCIFVITLSATLFVTFVGSAFTMTLAHLFPAKSVTLISMVVQDIATNLDVGCTKINKTQKMTADENHRRFKFILFEVSVKKSLKCLAVTRLVLKLCPKTA